MKRQNILFIILFISIIVLVALLDVRVLAPTADRNWTIIGGLFGDFEPYPIASVNPHSVQDLKLWNNITDFFRNIFNIETNQREESIFPAEYSQLNEEQKPLSKESPLLYDPRIEYEEAVIGAVDRATPSVVSIVVSRYVPVLERCPVTDPFFGPGFRLYIPCDLGRTQRVEVGGGTGFFVSSDGLILTNKHVVADRNAEYIIFAGEDARHTARVVAVDDVEDLALLKIEGNNFPALPLGNSDTVRLGQTAIAIGNALGEYKNTVSKGVISGLDRTVQAHDPLGRTITIEGVFQTDAAINPGNSGGPLINLKGEVIGVNTAIARGAENIGFAIPINKARELINRATLP